MNEANLHRNNLPSFSLAIEFYSLEEGVPEERETFGALSIFCCGELLTEVEDVLAASVRKHVYISANLLAEWLAWNWWRLTTEPWHLERSRTVGWKMAHSLRSINGGYVWPNLILWSDGRQMELRAIMDNHRLPQSPLRYLNGVQANMPLKVFERGAERFFDVVERRLSDRGLRDSSLLQLLRELREERKDSELALWRRLEAWLGYDPGEAEERIVKRVMETVKELGEEAVADLAATTSEHEVPPDTEVLSDIAEREGVAVGREEDGVDLDAERKRRLPSLETSVAWEVGIAAARLLREQERLGDAPISDEHLADMAAVPPDIFEDNRFHKDWGFRWAKEKSKDTLVLPSPYRTNRRFAVARLIGDKIASRIENRFRPVAKSYTYRQRMQRAFAGEFLCPYEALKEYLNNDFSDEAQLDAAKKFDVSPYVIGTMLINHGDIGRASFGGYWGNPY